MNPRTVSGIIVGCGTLGLRLATALDRRNCKVGIVDETSEAFVDLPESLRLRCFAGDPLELTVLELAGIVGADFVVAATPRDLLNTAIALACKRAFRTRRAIARVRDVRRAMTYGILGIELVCPSLALSSELAESLAGVPEPRPLP